jgi:hypothetical protein
MSTKIQVAPKKKKASKTSKRRKYDSAWKNIIRKLFKDFLEFFFPDIYEAIDFTKGVQFLDKELNEIDPDSNLGDRVADVLVKVHLKTGRTGYICIFIHLEVQNQAIEDFKMEYVPLWERDAERKGKKIGKLETAKNLLKMGIDIEKVSEATGLKKEELEKLREAPQVH